MRRVVAVLPSFAGGGAEWVTLALMKGLDRRRFEPHIVVLDGTGPLAAEATALPVSVLAIPRLRHAMPTLVKTLRRLAPDVVFSSLGYVNLALAACRGMYPGRLLLREANLPEASLPETNWPWAMQLAYRLLYPRADRVLATSSLMAMQLTSLGVPDDRLVVLPNPVDVASLRYHAVPPQRQPGAGRRLVAAGRLTRQKGFDRLLPLLAGLPDVYLTIFGNGPEQTALTAQAADLGVSLSLPGFVRDLPAQIAGADLFIMPSRWEGMPNVALEALACGVRVLATPEAGGIVELGDWTDGIQIVPVGPAFRAAIAATQPRRDLDLGPSLLPPQYESSNVLLRFMEVLDNCLQNA